MAASRTDIKAVFVVQCEVSRERCAGGHCALAFHHRRDAFAGYGPDVIFVPLPCGGCPGRRVSRLTRLMERLLKKEQIERDRIAVHLASCLVFDSKHYPPCPHVDYIRRILRRRGFAMVDGSFLSEQSAKRRAEGVYEND